MPKASRASVRPPAVRLAALLVLIFVASLAPAAGGVATAATPVTVGYRDHSYAEAPGGDDVTADRSQSKLWFHDGRWFGIMFDPALTTNAKFRIWRFDRATQDWTNTTIAVDDRNRSHADALSDGATLYVASARGEGAVGTTVRDLRIYKYSYNATAKTYALVAGFPKLIAGTAAGTGYATIAKDSTGRLWVAWTQASTAGAILPTEPAKVKISSSGDAGVTWSAPIDLPNMGSDVTNDDVAAIARLSGGGASGVGVLFSNQGIDDSFYFVPHVDGQPVGTWGARETAFGTASAYDADGHISLKTDAAGNLLAAVKTGRNDDPAPNGGDPQIAVLKRTGSPGSAGTWTNHEVTDVTTEGTRPILVIDGAANEANVFLTHPDTPPDGDQSIYRRTAPLATLNFGAPSIGQPFISSATEDSINDATSTKQVTTAESGILVEATNVPTLHYLHNCVGGACPAEPPTDDPFVDIADSQFRTDIIWVFEAGITSGCAVNPDRYCPDTNVTRGQMASFLARALELPSTSTDFFTDDETSIHEVDINRVAAAGITTGCTATTYCPTQVVTRGQMASFLARGFKLASSATDFFTDDETSIHEFDINRVANAGITTGCTPTTYCPTGPVTRGQMAAFLHRALD